MVDLTAAISLGGQAIGLVKQLNSIDKEFDKADLKLKIADLADKIVSLKIALTDARDEIAAKEAEIASLRQTKERSATLVDRDGFLYDPGTGGLATGHPYCPRCYNVDGRLIRTVRGESVLDSKCPQCSVEYHEVSSHSWAYNERQGHSHRNVDDGYDPFDA